MKKDRGAMAMKAAGQRRRPTSSVNRPRGRRTLVLLLVLLFVLALAGGGSYYYFFIYEAGAPGPVAQAPTPMPADPTATPQPTAPVPPPAAPPATTAPVPAPKPAPVPPPAKATPPKTPKPAPKPPKVTTLKPPPPRPPAPTRTAQPGSSVPAGSKYTVQFGIFSTEKSAQSLINRLKSKGIKSYIRPRKSSSGKFLYYVLLDDGFKTRDAALAKAHQIETTKGFDTTVHTL